MDMRQSPVSYKYVFWLLMSLGAVSSAVILGTVWWLTVHINQTDRAATYRLIDNTIHELQSSTAASTADYSFWTSAFLLVQARDAEGVYENVGSGATESELFDELHILSPDAQSIFRYGSTIDAPNETRLVAAALADLVKLIVATPPEDYAQRTHFVRWDGQFFIVSAALITPDDLSLLEGQVPNVLVGVRYIDAQYLDLVAQRSGHTGMALQSSPPAPDQDSIPMPSPQGNAIGYIAWDIPQKGTALISQVTPGNLVVLPCHIHDLLLCRTLFCTAGRRVACGAALCSD